MPSGGANKFSYEKVKMIFEEKGFKLLSSEYKTNNTKMDAICPCGKEISIRLSDVQRGRRCQECKGKTNSKALRTKEDEIRTVCEKHGCKLVKSWLQNSKTRLKFVCACGDTHEAYLSNFTRYPRCRQCGIKAKSGENCYMYDPDREAVALRKRFRKTCGRMIRRFMNATEQTKTRSTHELLGYTPMELQEHITSHPDYKTCTEQGDWHVDHIFPIQAFLDHKVFDLSLINHLTNLRPMPGKKNLSKADKYDEKEFEQWLAMYYSKKEPTVSLRD